MRRFRFGELTRRLPWKYGVLLFALVWVGAQTAIAGANVVPETGADVTDTAISANSMKPSQCAALDLVSVITGTGAFNGNAQGNLVLGSGVADTINGLGGTDCVLGGGGNDTLNGGAGADIILGGDGDDTINGGAAADTCIGGAGTDTFINCETIIDP